MVTLARVALLICGVVLLIGQSPLVGVMLMCAVIVLALVVTRPNDAE